MSRIAIIPARGGSKRIPRKNIRNFLGKPIIAYSIEAAKASSLFDEIMVSTDDEEIAEIAIKYGAKVPFLRSVQNSNDYATTMDVIVEVLNNYSSLGKYFDRACCIYATAPFVTSESIKAAYQVLDKGYTSVFPVLQYSFPIQRALKVNNDKIEMYSQEYLETRSQDLQKSYHDSGQFYWMDVVEILKSKELFSDNTSFIVLEEMEAQDIDTEEDWKVAEFKFRLLHDEA